MARVKGDLQAGLASLNNQWQFPLCKAPCEAPAMWCYGLFCPCCFSFQQRNKILDITGEPYACFGGTCGCCCCGRECSSRQPWLCLETCCCTSPSIIANRYLIQTRFGIMNDPCDDKMLTCLVCLQCVGCIVQCIAGNSDTGEAIEHLQHLINACLCGCMLAQQDAELKQQEGAYSGPPQAVYAMLPAKQQQMISARQALQQTPGAPLTADGRQIR